MTEIEFSIYGDQPSPLEGPFLDEFQAKHSIRVRTSRMTWDEAWPKLLNFAVYGGGPDISQIGAIWTSSLVSMNALRPFTSQEIDDLGGKKAFFEPTWQSAILPGRPQVWGIPFTAFTYIVLYRRDLLQLAGIAEQTAFESAQAMAETLKRLRAAGVKSPWVLPSGNPYRGRVHIASSWVWGAGGDWVSDDGQHVLFDQRQARAGLKAFFELYRHLSPLDYNLTYDACLHRFATGRAAMTIAGATMPATIKSWNENPQVLDNLGTAVVPGVPWVGGSNIVIWREAQAHHERERAAILLAKYLASRTMQVNYAASTNLLPTRSDALPSLQFEPISLRPTFERTLRTGRSYKPAQMWVRMLNDLSSTFDLITADQLADPALDVDQTLAKYLDPLARMFDRMLSR